MRKVMLLVAILVGLLVASTANAECYHVVDEYGYVTVVCVEDHHAVDEFGYDARTDSFYSYQEDENGSWYRWDNDGFSWGMREER